MIVYEELEVPCAARFKCFQEIDMTVFHVRLDLLCISFSPVSKEACVVLPR